MGNAEKAATLGMPYGTANNKLRKNILFHLLMKYGENICIRCRTPIETVDELSIEHIKPWEGRSAELFWDLNNIAFSHMACNLPHRRRGREPQRKVRPEGTNWCVGCQTFEPIENFWKRKSEWTGLEQYCKKTKHRKRQLSSMTNKFVRLAELADAAALKAVVERRAGSSPAPCTKIGDVAQTDRAFDSGSRGREFDSRRPRQFGE